MYRTVYNRLKYPLLILTNSYVLTPVIDLLVQLGACPLPHAQPRPGD